MGTITHTYEAECHSCSVYYGHDGHCLAKKPHEGPTPKPEKELCSRHGSLSKEITSAVCGVIRTYVLCLSCGLEC